MEFILSSKDGERILTELLDSPVESDSDYDNVLLITRPVNPVTVLIKLMVHSLGHKGNLVALLDLGCTRCLVNPAVIEKLGMRLRQLKSAHKSFASWMAQWEGKYRQCSSPS